MAKRTDIPAGQAELTTERMGIHEALELQFPLDPLLIIRGPNGGGKSTLLKLVARMLGDTSAEPQKTWGTEDQPARAELRVQGRELVLAIGEKRGISGAKGFPLRLASQHATDLADLIGPTDATESRSEGACKARLAALARIADLRATPERLAQLSSGLETDLRLYPRDVDLPTLTGLIRKRLRERLKSTTSDRDRAIGAIATLETSLEAEQVKVTCDHSADTKAVADAGYDTALAHLAAQQESHRQRRAIEAEHLEVSGKEPNPSWVPLQNVIARVTNYIAQYKSEELDRASWDEIDSLLTAIPIVARACRGEAETYTRIQAIYARPITGATAEDVDAARAGLDAAHAARAAELTSRTAHDAIGRIALKVRDAIVERDGHIQTIAALTTAIEAVQGQFSVILAGAGISSVSFSDDGDLLIRANGRWEPFAARSTSERIFDAFEVWTSCAKPEPDVIHLIMFDPDHWYHCGQSVREDIRAMLEPLRGKVVVMTEEHTPDGDIRIESV